MAARPKEDEKAETLGPNARFAYGALVASILGGTCRRYGAQWSHTFLHRLMAHLEVPPGGKEALLQLMDQDDPPCDSGPFAAMLLDDEVAPSIIVPDFILVSIMDGFYDARSRGVLREVARALQVPWEDVQAAESALAQQLREGTESEAAKNEREERERSSSWSKMFKVGAAGLGGAVLIGVTGGLAAPFVAAGMAGVIGASGAAVLATTGGLAAITALFGVAGGGLGVYHMSNRVGDIQEFAFVPVAHQDDNKLTVCIAVSGWIDEETVLVEEWKCLSSFTFSEQWVIRWETEQLMALSRAFEQLISDAMLTTAAQVGLTRTVLASVLSAVMWPLTLLSLGKIIDNPWNNCATRARDAGIMLAEVLLQHVHGNRPVTLYGTGLGGRVVYYCLLTLAEHGEAGRGIVDSAYLIGAPVPTEEFAAIQGVVASRLINGYSESDWLLKFVYRTLSAQTSVAGISAVGSDGVEDIDLSAVVQKQSEYPGALPTILHYIHPWGPEPVVASYSEDDTHPPRDSAIMAPSSLEPSSSNVAISCGDDDDDDDWEQLPKLHMWACSSCTLENDASSAICLACSSSRPGGVCARCAKKVSTPFCRGCGFEHASPSSQKLNGV